MTTQRLRGEAGATLAEAIVTIAILSVAIVGILGGMAAAIKASDVHRKLSVAETVVRSGAEGIKDPSVGYVPCAPLGSYNGALPAAPSGYTVSVSAVKYWNGSGPDINASAWADVCGTDNGMQRITVTAAGPDGTSESVTIVKRKQ